MVLLPCLAPVLAATDQGRSEGINFPCQAKNILSSEALSHGWHFQEGQDTQFPWQEGTESIHLLANPFPAPRKVRDSVQQL